MEDVKLVKSEKLPDTNFQQQNLKAWRPVLTPLWVVLMFMIVGVILVPLGVMVLMITSAVVETEVRYDNVAGGAMNVSVVNLTIPSDMEPPIFFYYKLVDFYQNHRLYVKSRESAQLHGDDVPVEEIDTKCAPLPRSHDGHNKLLYPCGLIAQSHFTDTYPSLVVSEPTGGNATAIDYTQQGISWEADREKFKPFSGFNNATMTNIGVFTGRPIDHLTEDFSVWMRTSGLPTFMKLRYIINTPLKKDQVVTVTINNIFDVTSFGGEKWVMLSTMSTLGGRNPFLGYFSIIMGGVSFLLAFGSGALALIKPRKLGDLSYFNDRDS